MPAENCGHNIPTIQAIYPERDTVIAPQESNSDSGPAISDPTPNVGQAGADALGPWEMGILAAHRRPNQNGKPGRGDGQRTPAASGRTEFGTVLRLSIDELTMLAPRLRIYLK
jgi:hypothetical protein